MQKLLLPLLAMLFLISCEKENSNDLLSDQEFHDNASDNLRRPASKIDVCHYDAEYNTWHVINISENAWLDHAGHGDVQLIDQDGDGYVTSSNECGLPVDCDDTDAGLTDNCPTCFDGVQNQGEEGVDCGGPCPDCPTCFDGIQNQGEEGVDCGGPCPDCPTCFDGIQNQGEDDVDCGGPCQACSTGCVEGELAVTIDPDGEPGSGDEYTLYVYPQDNSTAIPWSSSSTVTGATYSWDGDANTDAIVSDQGAGNTYAAGLCASLKTDGCDWYLPALNELNAMYQQLGPNGSGDMPSGIYWSSTEFSFSSAWTFFFAADFQGLHLKNSDDFRCRCVRR